MILSILLSLLGITIFLGAGFILCVLLFPDEGTVTKIAFTIALSIGFWGILSNVLNYLNLFNQINLLISATIILLPLLFIANSRRNKVPRLQNEIKEPALFVLLASLFGTIWKLLAIQYFKINSFGIIDSYGYSFKFIGKSVPDLGFYTGMARDKSEYIGGIINSNVLNHLNINYEFILIFLATLLYVSFIYILFKEFGISEKLARFGVIIMSVGPVELFHMITNIYGHSLSYFIVLPLFLLYISNKKNLFWLVGPLIVIILNTYYTSSIVIILTSAGFIISLIIRDYIHSKNIGGAVVLILKNKKILAFLMFLVISAFYTLFISPMGKYSIGRFTDKSDSALFVENIILQPNQNITLVGTDTEYINPSIVFLSSIRWQMLFFFLCGITFIFYLAKNLISKKKIEENEMSLVLCLVPVLLVTYGFIHVNLPTRIFDYFAFYGLMTLTISKKYSTAVYTLLLILLLLTGLYTIKDKKVFFYTAPGERAAAQDISKQNIFSGTIFSDQVFANHLILQDFYKVTGAGDKDALVQNLFYQKDKDKFLEAIRILYNAKIEYIAITNRMRERYILMVNFPQTHMTNSELYSELESVYNNGEVTVYKTKK